MEKTFGFEYLGINRERRVFFNLEKLDERERRLIEDVGTEVIKRAEAKGVLDRCTFFVELGLEALEEIIPGKSEIVNSEIRGCDNNPLDQHYWLEFSLKRGMKRVIIDPIFGYVGLLDIASNTIGSKYYNHSRKVIPNKHVSEGGVRINTNSVM